jgi:hypothetical protein
LIQVTSPESTQRSGRPDGDAAAERVGNLVTNVLGSGAAREEAAEVRSGGELLGDAREIELSALLVEGARRDLAVRVDQDPGVEGYLAVVVVDLLAQAIGVSVDVCVVEGVSRGLEPQARGPNRRSERELRVIL